MARTCLVSFPKSGRTWLRLILEELGLDFDRTHAGASYNEGCHFSALNTDAAKGYEQILLLIRDPRDTALSGYHWFRTNIVDSSYPGGGLSEFIRDPHYGVEKVARYNLMWWSLAHPAMMRLTYEAMHEATAALVADVVAFLGATPDEAAIQRAVQDATFSEMRKRETVKVNKRLSKTGGEADPNSFHARSGRVGSYRQEMSADDIAYCDEVLNGLGYFRATRQSI